MSELLSIRGLRASYGNLEVLHGIDLDVGQGEITCLIGANGAGKSTLLKSISGLVKRVSGDVRFDGEPLLGRAAHEIVGRGVVHVPEGRRVFPRMSVDDNLHLGAYLRNDSQGIDADREAVLELFPRLRERLKQVAGTLSGGEQQMLAMARGLMARPRLLLLDEPSLGLAPRLVEEIFSTIRRIHENGTSLLLVEQNANAALAIATRGHVLETGRVVLAGSAEDLRLDEDVKRAYLGAT